MEEKDLIGNGNWGAPGEGFDDEYFIPTEITRSYGFDKKMDQEEIATIKANNGTEMSEF